MPTTIHAPVRIHVSPRLVGALFLGVVLPASVALLYLSQSKVISATAFSSTPGTQAAASASAATGSRSVPQEMQVANDGMTYLQNARIEAVSGNEITVGITWGSAIFSWTVQTSGNTKFLDQNGNDESSATLVPGEYVNVTGQLDQLENSPTISAQYVRES